MAISQAYGILTIVEGFFKILENKYLINISFEIKDKKKELYQILYNNAEFYEASYCLVFYCIMFLLFNDEHWYLNLPTAGLLYSTEYYKQFKGRVVGFKPTFVASMWTFSAVILPAILHDHDYSILGDVGDYLPCFLLLFACTTLADIKDIAEDVANEVNTIQVVFGKKKDTGDCVVVLGGVVIYVWYSSTLL